MPDISHLDMSFSNNNKKGLTIVEVIVSVIVIIILGAGLFGAFAGTQRLFNFSSHKAQAINFSMEALDRLRCDYKYSDSQMSLTTAASDADDHLESEIGAVIRGEMSDPALSAALKYDVIDTGSAANGYKKVIIKVHWDERTL